MNFRNHTRSCIHTDANGLTRLRAMHSYDLDFYEAAHLAEMYVN